MPSYSLLIPRETDRHKEITSRLTDFIKMAERGQEEMHPKWQQAEDDVLAYVPESELDAKRRIKRDQGGQPGYTTINIPYSYALLMTAHTYWASVFLGRAPVHQYSGVHGEGEQQVQAVEALINYQTTNGNILPPYYLWLYDAGKYGVGVIGTYWMKDVIRYTEIMVVQDENGQPQTVQVTNEVEGYEGNHVYNISPFDFLPDPRVPVSDFQRGEFAGIKRCLGWNEVVKRKAQGYYTNVEQITTTVGTRQRDTQHSQLRRPHDDDIYGTANMRNGHPPVVHIYEVYVELIPREWGLSQSDFPEKWVFTITQDLSVVIGCQPLGYRHNQYPLNVLEVEVEAYARWTRGLMQQTKPIQDTMNWLLNSHFYNVRASANNQFLADPSKVVMKDLQSSEPGLIIRLKPEAYGQDIKSFFMQLPVQDVTAGHVNDMSTMFSIGERATGINDQLMGMMTGGRKTATEVRTSTGFGVNRLKTISEYMSVQGFSKQAKMMLQASQQYYSVPKKLRLVGDIAAQDGGKFVMVTPEDIAGFYDFVPVDGTLPIDRMAQANLWKEILMGLRQIPEVGMTYDIGRIFGHLALLGGVRNLQQFQHPTEVVAANKLKAQLAEAGALASEAQKGNVVPLNKPKQSDTRGTGVQAPNNRG